MCGLIVLFGCVECECEEGFDCEVVGIFDECLLEDGLRFAESSDVFECGAVAEHEGGALLRGDTEFPCGVVEGDGFEFGALGIAVVCGLNLGVDVGGVLLCVEEYV